MRYHTADITIRVSKRVKTESPGGITSWKPEYSHSETHTIRLEIDEAGLFQMMGEQAARNKTGRSTEAGGLIVARRVGKARRLP